MPENETNPADEKLLILPLGEESKKITQVITNDTARQVIELLADAPLSASDIADRLKVPLTTIAYNLENLEDVGLVKVERIKYSEKGREVKIYAPVRKLIVVVPEKTDRNSVGDVIRKYLGIILATVLASSFIEFFMRSRSTKMFTSNSNVMPAPNPAVTAIPASTAVNETTTGVSSSMVQSTPMISPVPSVEIQSMPAANSTMVVPAPTSVGEWNVNATATPVPMQPPIPEATSPAAAPDFFTNLANGITAHPGFLFLLGCLFVIALLIALDFFRKRKNG